MNRVTAGLLLLTALFIPNLVLGDDCVPETPEIREQVEKTKEANEAAFQEALAKKRMKLVEVRVSKNSEIRTPGVGEVGTLQREDNRLLFVPYSKKTHSPEDDLYVVVGWAEASPSPVYPEFARDKKDRLWIVKRKPKVLSTVRHFLCGCGFMMGGAPQAEGVLLVKLSGPKEWGGVKEISYEVNEVQLTYNNRMKDGDSCSLPQ